MLAIPCAKGQGIVAIALLYVYIKVAIRLGAWTVAIQNPDFLNKSGF
ncbi:hypothetical protein [Nostoc sp. UIC 10630]|nr:hypothetical protein [Nostoc sp. UIC 10630]NEU82014.1 hypothetical protein [Nostoc sp. UIC 10630]